ncbi:MAG: HAD family hydrolase [Terriglobia bacterium]
MQTKVKLFAAAIFDMDGVLVNSNPFHVEKWAELLNERKIPFDQEGLSRQILGQRNDHVFRLFFGAEMDEEDMRNLEKRLEENFRQAFRAHARPLRGLQALLRQLQAAGIPVALASSAMRENVDFVVDALGFRPYFRSIISGDDVRFPKPHPEIYLETAERLRVEPSACVAFEDSFVGIESAKAAGMKCVAIASTFPAGELRANTGADLVARDFQKLSLPVLQALFARSELRLRGAGSLP